MQKFFYNRAPKFEELRERLCLEEKLDAFLTFNEKNLLNHSGKISAQVAEKLAVERYIEFDENRKELERLQEDENDRVLLAELQATEKLVEVSVEN